MRGVGTALPRALLAGTMLMTTVSGAGWRSCEAVFVAEMALLRARQAKRPRDKGKPAGRGLRAAAPRRPPRTETELLDTEPLIAATTRRRIAIKTSAGQERSS